MSSSHTPDIAVLEQRLQAERRDMLKQLEARLHRAGEPARLALSADAGEIDDRLEADILNDTSIAMLDHELVRLREIDGALERIKGHSYGICTDCGEAIAAPRLEAEPATAHCIACQERIEKRQGNHHARF